jgi:hypothetical protein
MSSQVRNDVLRLHDVTFIAVVRTPGQYNLEYVNCMGSGSKPNLDLTLDLGTNLIRISGKADPTGRVETYSRDVPRPHREREIFP